MVGTAQPMQNFTKYGMYGMMRCVLDHCGCLCDLVYLRLIAFLQDFFLMIKSKQMSPFISREDQFRRFCF